MKSIPRCSECGKPLTCMCMSCRGRARTKRKQLSGRRNIAKAQKAKEAKRAIEAKEAQITLDKPSTKA